MDKLIWETWGEFKTIVSPGTAGGPCVVFFHGYGANAQDLASLAPYLNVPKGTTLMFPDAPNKVDLGMGQTGRAWFNINIREIQEAIAAGVPRDLSNSRPQAMTSVRDRIKPLAEKLVQNHSAVVFGGFSQGSMLATELVFNMNPKPKGLVVLSGNLVDKTSWEKSAPSCRDLPFFMSHGTNDVVLGYEGAEALENLFHSAGLVGGMLSFRGGHEIPPKVVESLNQFLSQLLRSK